MRNQRAKQPTQEVVPSNRESTNAIICQWHRYIKQDNACQPASVAAGALRIIVSYTLNLLALLAICAYIFNVIASCSVSACLSWIYSMHASVVGYITFSH